MKARFLGYLMALILLLTVAGAAAAQSTDESTATHSRYPDYLTIYVSDFAGVIGPEVEDDMTRILQDLRETAGVEATVVTIDSYRDYDTDDRTFEEFATSLFNTWGVGDADSDGVMILMGVDDRKIRVEVGVSYERTLNDEMQTVIDEYALPRFRAGDYEAGIYDTLIQVADVIKVEKGVFESSTSSNGTGVLATPRPRATESVSSVRTASDNDSNQGISASTPLALGGLAALAGGGFLGVRRVLRMRPRKCPSCGTKMYRLDEYADDEFLTDGQRAEEGVGSVDYDVWKCNDCGTHQIFDYYGLSFYSHCPNCNYKTLSRDSRLIDSATCYSTGLREASERCANCRYENTWEEVIPMRDCSESSSSSSGFSSSSSSSSSSSGSFGGGRSSGGGASGSW